MNLKSLKTQRKRNDPETYSVCLNPRCPLWQPWAGPGETWLPPRARSKDSGRSLWREQSPDGASPALHTDDPPWEQQWG